MLSRLEMRNTPSSDCGMSESEKQRKDEVVTDCMNCPSSWIFKSFSPLILRMAALDVSITKGIRRHQTNQVCEQITTSQFRGCISHTSMAPSPYLEEYSRPHAEETVHYPERKHHRHTVYEPVRPRRQYGPAPKDSSQTLQTQEPWERCD